MAEYIWTFRVYADLGMIHRQWWTALKEYVSTKYECTVSYRKDRHAENNMWVPYRLCIRGYEVLHAAEEVLDKLCTEHPHCVRPWDVDSLPYIGEERCSQEQKESRWQGWVMKFSDDGSGKDQALRVAFLGSRTSAWETMLGDLRVSADTVEALLTTLQELRDQAGIDRHDQVPHHDEPHGPQPQRPSPAEAGSEDRSVLLETARRAYKELRAQWFLALQKLMRKDMLRYGLYFSEKFRMFDQPCPQLPTYHHHVCFCVQSFKRTFQLARSIGHNVATTWQFRAHITWLIVDFNEDERILEGLASMVPFAVMEEHVRVFRPAEPMRYYDCSLAKNTAHMATQALTGKYPPEWLYVVNVDNDNMITQEFCLDALDVALQELRADVEQPGARVGTQWNSKDLGTYGRIGMPWLTFLRLGGYDQGMKGMGAQDTDIMWRLGLIGRVEKKQVLWSGLSVPNQENKVDDLLAGNDKDRRQAYEDEKAEKMRNVDPRVFAEFGGSFKAMNTYNRVRAQSNWQRKRWRVNEDLEAPGLPIGESELKSRLRQVYGFPDDMGVEEVATVAAPAGSSSSTDPRPTPQAGLDRQSPLPPLPATAQSEQAGPDSQAPRPQQRASRWRPLLPTGLPCIQPQFVCSMGTRTLTYSYPSNRCAKQMHQAMWPRAQYVGQRQVHRERIRLNHELAKMAAGGCGSEFSFCEETVLVDCTHLSGFTAAHAFDSQGHVGMHELIQQACVRHARFPDMVSQLVIPVEKILWGARLAVVFWCNAGEHRSVACAEIFRRWLAAVLPPANGEHVVRHLCSSEWTRRGCGNCSRCRTKSVVTQTVDEMFAAEMSSRSSIRQALTART